MGKRSRVLEMLAYLVLLAISVFFLAQGRCVPSGSAPFSTPTSTPMTPRPTLGVPVEVDRGDVQP